MHPLILIFFALTTPLIAQAPPAPSLPVSLDVPLGVWGLVPAPFHLPETGHGVLRTEPRKDAPISFRANPGEKFTPLRQSIRVERPYVMIARETLTVQTIGGPRQVATGDTLYGLGGDYVWYGGRLDTLQQGLGYLSDPRLRSICSQRITYWIQFRRESGEIGWLPYATSRGTGGACRFEPELGPV
jgi:hypothetical protein